MNRLDLAVRRYHQLFPTPETHSDPPESSVTIWLAEDVAPVLADYTHRPRFRERAAWSIRVLRAGAETPERRLIESAGRQLAGCARAVSQLCRKKRIRTRLRERFPPGTGVPMGGEEIISSNPQASRIIRHSRDTIDELALELSQVENMALESTFELVNVNDYLEPQPEWISLPDGTWIPAAGTIVAVTPSLLSIGNFVVRRLLNRIYWRHHPLQRVRERCRQILDPANRTDWKDWTTLETAWTDYEPIYQQLESRFRSEREMALTDSCVACTQLYAAIHPEPDLTWLDIPDEIIESGIGALRARMRGFRRPEMLERIAAHLNALRRLYRTGEAQESAWEEAIASGGLALNREHQTAHWNRQKLDLSEGELEFLSALAARALRRSVVRISDVFGDKVVTDSALSSAWNRLKNALPQELHTLVEPGGLEKGTYRLNLAPEHIHLFS